MSKGGPFKSTGMKGHPTPSGSNQMPSHRPQLVCTACGGSDHLRKDCHEDVFCNNCRTRSHATEMCRATSHQSTSNMICIYCGSVNHTSGKCHNKPNDNREEPRSTPRDLREQGPRINYSRMGHRPQVSHHQIRFDEGLNTQYSPNYINPHQSMRQEQCLRKSIDFLDNRCPWLDWQVILKVTGLYLLHLYQKCTWPTNMVNLNFSRLTLSRKPSWPCGGHVPAQGCFFYLAKLGTKMVDLPIEPNWATQQNHRSKTNQTRGIFWTLLF